MNVPLDHKQAAVDFLQLVASGDVRTAYRKHVHPDLRHHTPFFRGDRASLLEAMEENARQFAHKLLEVHRVIEEGDQVAVLSRVALGPGEASIAVVHLFRFEGDLITELWDIGQTVPENSPNEHGMF